MATTTQPAPTTIVATTTTAKPEPVHAPVTTTTHPLVVRPASVAATPQPPTPSNSGTRLQRTSQGATITNTQQPTATSDALRARYDSMARDFAAQPGGTYTVQFELVCETASVTRAIAEAGSKVWFVPMSYRGRPCYRVFWGRYDSSAEAGVAAKQLPAGLGATPVVVKIPR